MTTALITGASSGLGEAFARRLAAEGHDLFLVARSADKLEALCNELSAAASIEARYYALDLSEEASDEKLFAETESLGIRVDLLINNAGFGSMGDFVDLPLERELEMIDLNIRALVALTHRYLPAMRARQAGTVVNVSSAAGFQPIPFMATYAATKSFVTAFSESIAAENRPFGIQVLALCPGSTKTNFWEASNIDRVTTAKGQETPEDVVETAMRAIGGSRAKVVSGWTNYIAATAATFIPNSLITKALAKGLRGRYQKAK
jgi:short-subunit dehydrogenase